MRRKRERAFSLGDYWLDKRPDRATDAWQICWYDSRRRKTRMRSTGTDDFELAQRALAEHFILKGERREEPAEAVLISHVLMRYYEAHAKDLPSAHFAGYAIERWNEFWKADTVGDMTEDRLEEFVKFLRVGKKRDAKSSTVRRVLAVGRAALERAIARTELKSAPAVPYVQVERQRLYRATPAQLASLLNASDSMPWVRRWLIGSMVTLGRPEAVLQLSRPQMDFDLRRIDMNPPGRSQTDKGRPVVPMTETAYQWMAGDWTGLWIQYNDRPLASIRMGFERARAKAGLPTTITPYTIRRTLSTDLRRRGVPPWEIAGFLGHTVREYAITEEYAIYSPDYLSAAARTLDAYCAELQPLLDFELLHASCTPENETVDDKSEINQVGRLGLEPRTNTLKGDRSPNNISRLRRRG